jgi:hypothetical protein
MGFSRRKSCAFLGFDDTTLSKWVQDDAGLSIKLTSWENVNTALALANIHQALKNESILVKEKGEVKLDNSWKLVSKLEDGYKDKLDVTSNDKTMTVTGFTFVKNGDNNTADNSD